MNIQASVGRGGVNRNDDTRKVQLLLNNWISERGLTLLAVDGIVGPKTIASIESFQRARTGIVDGRVDPTGPTMRELSLGVESASRLLKTFAMLSVVLSYDPRLEIPSLNGHQLMSDISRRLGASVENRNV